MNGLRSTLSSRTLLFGCVASLAVTAGLGEALPVHAAGGGGHQIHYVSDRWCGSGDHLGSLGVEGTNQNGRRVTWWGHSTDGRTVDTTGWWWVGAVTIHYGSGPGVTPAYVPADDDSKYLSSG
ncbi:MAG TPA: hypothetical protein VF112_08540, partial [Candidatus Dormibacteraeota bacterium]